MLIMVVVVAEATIRNFPMTAGFRESFVQTQTVEDEASIWTLTLNSPKVTYLLNNQSNGVIQFHLSSFSHLFLEVFSFYLYLRESSLKLLHTSPEYVYRNTVSINSSTWHD
jgi:hypothetical protein